MTITSIKTRCAAILLRLATHLNPAPASPVKAAAPVEAPGEPTLQYLAMQAIAWMAYASMEERVAAAALLRRHYPDISPYIMDAHKASIEFTELLRGLIAQEQAQLDAPPAQGTDSESATT